jgi:predicted GIY-YIG superfamily endonuclease
MFFVYILKCSDGSYYTGHTDNLESRIAAHDDGSFGGYTVDRLPVNVVHVQEFQTRDEAFAAERQIKGWSRRKKEALIQQDWNKLQRYAMRFKKFETN